MKYRLESNMHLANTIISFGCLVWLDTSQALTVFSNADFVSQFAVRHERLSVVFYIPPTLNLKMLIDHRLSMLR